MIAVVLACEVKAEPPVQVYLEEFEEAGVDYRIICWASRSDSPLHQNPPGCIEFRFKHRDGSFRSKFWNYLRFRRFLKKQLKRIKPDKMVFIPTQAGVLLPRRFFRYNHGKYFFDYRDPGYENHRFYLSRVLNMVEHSFATAISSRGFLKVLRPSDKYVIAHNVYSYEAIKSKKRSRSGRFVITSVGTLRTPEFAINQIKAFINDARFEIRLYGTADNRTLDTLRSFLQKNNVFNVLYVGRFEDGELPKIINECDALLVYYLSELDGLYHLPDRLYLGMQYSKPMIGNSDTYCGRYIVENGLGTSLNPRQPNLDSVCEFLSSVDYDKIYMNAKHCLEEARCDNGKWREIIRNFIKS